MTKKKTKTKTNTTTKTDDIYWSTRFQPSLQCTHPFSQRVMWSKGTKDNDKEKEKDKDKYKDKDG